MEITHSFTHTCFFVNCSLPLTLVSLVVALPVPRNLFLPFRTLFCSIYENIMWDTCLFIFVLKYYCSLWDPSDLPKYTLMLELRHLKGQGATNGVLTSFFVLGLIILVCLLGFKSVI